jgi:hypothetical protein
LSKSCDKFTNNAKIDGKLISEIWPGIFMHPDIGPEIKIVLKFFGTNLNIEEITKEMKMEPTKIMEYEDQPIGWIYIFTSKDRRFDVSDIMEDFIYKMRNKTDTIVKLREKYTEIDVILVIAGNLYDNTTFFKLPINFVNFAHKINTPILFDQSLVNCV